MIDDSFGMGFGEIVVGVDSRDKYTKNENVMNHERPQDKSYQYILKLAVLRLRLLTAVLPDTVHSVMVTVEPSSTEIPPP